MNIIPNNQAETEYVVTCEPMQTSLESFEAIISQMRDVTKRKKDLEKEQTETLAQLHEKQNKLQWKLNCLPSEKIKLCQTIEALQSKNRELEKKMDLQNMHYEELMLEMAAIKRSSTQKSSTSKKNSTEPCRRSKSSSQEVQTSPQTNVPGYQGSITSHSSYTDLQVASVNAPSCLCSANHSSTLKPYWDQPKLPCSCPVTSDQELPSATSSNESTCFGDPEVLNLWSIPPQNNSLAYEIDKIMAKIDQDNRILAELDKTRSIIATKGSTTVEQLYKLDEMGVVPTSTCQQLLPTLQCLKVPGTTSQSTIQQTEILSNTFPQRLLQYDMNDITQQSLIPLYCANHIPVSQPTYNVVQPDYQINYSGLLPFDLEGVGGIKNSNLPVSNFASTSDLLLPHDDLIPKTHSVHSHNMVKIPGKGLCNIFIAKYTYDPFLQSKNIYSDSELAINAGDYLLVYTEPDDEGYVDAELMDGRRGLVPITYIQKLSGDELLEFNQRVMIDMKECDRKVPTTIPYYLEHVHSDELGKRCRSDHNNEDTTEDEEEIIESASVPVPRQLTLERQLNKSILIRWNPPEESFSHCIDSYHVYVDGVLKMTIKASERTKALLEGVDSTRPHRISVRTVTSNRRTSRDAACTMLIGKDVPRYPTNLKASNITATSAVISWMPSNSNYQHTVCVNNIEICTVKPSVYKHLIMGLVPNTIYRVTVCAKNIRAPQFDDKSTSDKFSSYLDFRTLPKGMPDPPAEILVELGPQDGTLLVTWTPVTAQNSIGAPITGYAVYADGKKVIDIDSPTGDHALVNISKIASVNPRHVTVRTKSKENHSCDSNSVAIPPAALKEKHSLKGKNYNRPLARNAYGQIIIDPEENLSDKEVYPGQNKPAQMTEITKKISEDDNYSEEEFLGTHKSPQKACFNQSLPQTHVPFRNYHDTCSSSGPNPGQERNLPRPNYDFKVHDSRRDYRDYQHLPNQLFERRRTGDTSKTGRGNNLRVSVPGRMQVGSSNATLDNKSRIVVALFDYDPENMSPNPTTCHEELPFLQGDRIKLLSDRDPDGFYWGECRGKQGYVPQNMITELDTAPKVNKRNTGLRSSHNKYMADISHSANAKKMVALYNYNPHENSPNPDSDHELRVQEMHHLPEKITGLRVDPMGMRVLQRKSDGNSSGLEAQNILQNGCQYQNRTYNPTTTDCKIRTPKAPSTTLISNGGKSSGIGGQLVITETNDPKFPKSTNVMQKLSEITGNAEHNPVDNILSKGKDLIFMKFGLGK